MCVEASVIEALTGGSTQLPGHLWRLGHKLQVVNVDIVKRPAPSTDDRWRPTIGESWSQRRRAAFDEAAVAFLHQAEAEAEAHSETSPAWG